MSEWIVAGQITGAGATWLWDRYGKNLFDKATGEWKRFQWPEAEERYRQQLREQYSCTRLLGTSKSIEIENIYTDVYVLDKLSAERRYSLEELKNGFEETRQFSLKNEIRSPLIDLVTKEKRLYLLGKPGAGKTTFLRYLIMQACDGKIQETPIFIELKDWAVSELDLMDYMVRQFEICAFPDALVIIKYLLEHGYALVLFDGLDKVNQEGEQRARMIRVLRDFVRQYPKTRICLTCRIAASEYLFEKFTYLEIADFNNSQVQQFARKWYQDDQAKGERFLEEIGKPEHAGLKELTCTPILLTLLCLAFDQTLGFPSNPTELYQDALDALLRKWDISRGILRDSIYKDLTPNRKENMLAQIAKKNFDDNCYLMSGRLLAGQIASYLNKLPAIEAPAEADGDAVLKAIEAQHGILVERAHSIHSFSHLTFQEYLTARHIIENGSNALDRLIKPHLTDNRWREVFLMTASLLPDASEFFEIFLLATIDLIRADPVCFDMLQCAHQIAQSKILEQGKSNNELVLIIYVHNLAASLDLDRDLTHEFNQETKRGPANTPLRNIIRDRARLLNFDLDHILDRALKLALERTTARILTRTRTRRRDRNLNRALDRDNDRARAIDIALNQARKRTRLYTRNRKLDSELANDLHFLLSQYYGIELSREQKGCEISIKQFQTFSDYITANQLLFDCLNLAVVPDRERILSHIFIPRTD